MREGPTPLDCHYIHAAIHQARSECVPQRMSRHAFDFCLSTCTGETRFQINKRLSGIEIVENEFAFPAQCPGLQNLVGFRVHRNHSGLLCLGRKDRKNIFFEIHMDHRRVKISPVRNPVFSANRITS